MSKVVLISCVSRKKDGKLPAGELYDSPLFKYNLKYAKTFNPDKIFVLSAKYGIVDINEEIEPYDLTLNNMKKEEIKSWADQVILKLSKISDLNNDRFIFLAGERYRKFLIPEIKNFEIPMKGLGIGRQLKFLKDNTR